MIRLIDFANAQLPGIDVRVDAAVLDMSDEVFQAIAATALRAGGGPGFRAHRAEWDADRWRCRSFYVTRLAEQRQIG